MQPFPHQYEVHLTDRPSAYAEVSTGYVPSLRVASPREFDGPGDAWSPEHLLLASVQACFLLTFRAIARASKLDFTSLDVDAHGIVDRQNGATRFTEITLRPKLVVAAGTDRERALHLLNKAEKNCLVSASLSAAVHVRPEIIAAWAVA